MRGVSAALQRYKALMDSLDRFAQAMEDAHAASLRDGTPADSAYVDFALANPSAYRLMFDVSQPTA